MNLLIRLIRALPLLVVLAVVALVVYLVVSGVKSPERAKEVLIKLFGVLTSALTVFFCTASAYAWLESNWYVLDLFGAFAAVSALALVVTLVCRRRFIKNHPDYKFDRSFFPKPPKMKFPW